MSHKDKGERFYWDVHPKKGPRMCIVGPLQSGVGMYLSEMTKFEIERLCKELRDAAKAFEGWNRA